MENPNMNPEARYYPHKQMVNKRVVESLMNIYKRPKRYRVLLLFYSFLKMAQKHVLRFSSINLYFANDSRLIIKGENAVESNHVENMLYNSEVRMIRGEVHASMRNKLYQVQISVDADWLITEATCTCPRGQVLCHHMAALAIFAHYNLSVTDVACSWSARKTLSSEVKTIGEIYPPKTHQSTDRKLLKTEIDKLKEDLSQFGGAVGFTWLLSAEPSLNFQQICVDVEDFIFSEDYAVAENKPMFIFEKMHLSEEKIKMIFFDTVGQFKNDNWLMCRKHRLTASKFGLILAAIKKNKYSEAFFKSLTDSYNLDGIRAIQWGRTHEEAAIKLFEESSNKKVARCGIWLDECGFLGASTDGLLGPEEILEVKCPFKYRATSLFEGIQNEKNYIVSYLDGKYEINKNHNYYHQIQGQLWIMKKKICHLLIWTPLENLWIQVEKDDQWEENLIKLKDFYVNVYVNNLLK